MALPIIAAIRQRRDLKESLTHTAQELAHLASIYGVVRVSYSYLAQKCHCSRRTVIRHIQRLEAAKILRKAVVWIRGNFCEINTYTFRIAWDQSRPKGGSDTTASTLPHQEREKNSSLREDVEKQKKSLRFLTPGSDVWQKICEEIARLEGLLKKQDKDSEAHV
jgi:DNA-binding Lrp family transcriptional regulator